jgi:hypothetical protein
MNILVEGQKIISGPGVSAYNAEDGQENIYIDPGEWPEGKRKYECLWDGASVIEKTVAQLLSDYKKMKAGQLKEYISENLTDIILGIHMRTEEEIRSQYGTFETNINTASTKTQVDTLFKSFYEWLINDS